MSRLFLVILLLLACTSLTAQDLGLSMDRTRILIGEPIKMTLKARFSGPPAGWFAIDSLPHFEILDRSRIDTAGSELSQTLTITSWDSGKWTIPALPLGVNQTDPVTVSVSYSPMDPAQPYHDIRDILEVKPARDSNWYWYFLFAMVLIALFMLFFPAGEKKKDSGFVSAPGAYRDAMQRLDALRARTGEEPKIFYTELVEVFRDYLQRRRNIHSHAQTTDDLAIRIRALQLPQEFYSELLQTLRLSDGVKFARYRPDEAERTASLETIRGAIRSIEELRMEPQEVA